MPDLRARPVTDGHDELGEGPRWHAARSEFLWVDILTGVLRRARWADERLSVVQEYRLDRPVGAAAPVAGGGYLLAAADGLAWLSDEGQLTPVAGPASRIAADPPGRLRMNDAVCDPTGRFWAGSMPYDTSQLGAGQLVRYDPDGSLHQVLPSVTVSNGLAWNTAMDTMYYADSASNVVWQFDFEADSGTATNRRAFVEIDGAVPDGMCRDDDDQLWVAAHGGGRVCHFDPLGRLVSEVEVPGVSGVTACALGGAERTTLFITTSREGLDERGRAAEPEAGRVHAVEVDTPGPPTPEFTGVFGGVPLS